MDFLNSLTQESAIASFTDFKTRMTEYVASWEVPIPVIALSLVVVFCVHLGLKVLREGSAEKKLQDAMYEETGIDGKYHFSLPKEEKVCPHVSLLCMCVGYVQSDEGFFDVFESEREATSTGSQVGVEC